jgi:hypothetical protein
LVHKLKLALAANWIVDTSSTEAKTRVKGEIEDSE